MDHKRYTVHMNISPVRQVTRSASARRFGIPVDRGRAVGSSSECPGQIRVYRETVIVDDDLILVGVPTGESDTLPDRFPSG